MTIKEMEQRLDEITERIWWLDMIDILHGREKEEWENLTREQRQLIVKIRLAKENA